MTADSSETYLRRCEEKHKEIERRLKWYSLLLRKNQNYIDVLCAMPENIGRFTITEQPEAYYFVNNADDVFSMSEDVRALFNDWMAYYPFVENFYSIEPEALSGGDADFHFHRGFTIKRMWADVLPVLLNDSARRIPKRPAVYTVVRTANSRVFTAGRFAGALDFISANGLRVCDAIQGNVLTCVHEDGQTVRYMEVWLPVGPKDGEL